MAVQCTNLSVGECFSIHLLALCQPYVIELSLLTVKQLKSIHHKVIANLQVDV